MTDPAPSPHAPFKAVIFDCDGVLVDSRQAHALYFNRVRAAVGLPSLTLDEEDYVFTHAVEDSLRRIIPAQSLDDARQAAADQSLDDLLPAIVPQPGVRDLLARLPELGLKTAVNTNAGREAHLILETVGLTGCFDVVVTAADVARPKPDPEGVTRILSELGVTADEAVFIGDSEVDRLTAQAAGVTFWAFRNKALAADGHIDDFHLLREALPAFFRRSAPAAG